MFINRRCNKVMQTRDTLDNTVESGKNNDKSKFFCSQFLQRRCRLSHRLHLNPDFESGFVNIQRNKEAAMTEAEK